LLKINEIFGPVIQGEGPVIGWPSMFIRAQGCDFRCSWCDTGYAFDSKDGTEMSNQEIFDQLKNSAGDCRVVTLTGGNPVLQDFSELIEALHKDGWTVVLETQGTVFSEWVQECDIVVVSPKPPSSKMPMDQTKLRAYMEIPHVSLKIVVFDEADFEFAMDLHERYEYHSMYLQPGNMIGVVNQSSLINKLKWLSQKVLTTPGMLDTTILPQLHVLMYGNERGR
jgi:7-carboxy-7-deazaguanine synthase